MNSRTLRRLLGVTVVAILLYGASVFYTGYHAVARAMEHFQWSALGGAVALASCNYGLRYLKWEYYLHRLGVTGVGKFDSLLIFLSGFVLTITPGKIGEVFKSVVLARTHGVPMTKTALIVVAERLTDVIAVVALVLFGSLSFSGGGWWALSGVTAIGLGLVAILWQAPSVLLLGWLERTRFQRSASQVGQALTNLRVLATPSALPVPVLLSLLGWGAEGYALWLLLHGLGEPSGVLVAVFFYSTATLAGALVPMPGGLGVTEALIQQQLVVMGGTSAAGATAAMVLVRLATLWWAVLVGFAALGALKLRFGSALELQA